MGYLLQWAWYLSLSVIAWARRLHFCFRHGFLGNTLIINVLCKPPCHWMRPIGTSYRSYPVRVRRFCCSSFIIPRYYEGHSVWGRGKPDRVSYYGAPYPVLCFNKNRMKTRPSTAPPLPARTLRAHSQPPLSLSLSLSSSCLPFSSENVYLFCSLGWCLRSPS